jgi:hypothetical protein
MLDAFPGLDNAGHAAINRDSAELLFARLATEEPNGPPPDSHTKAHPAIPKPSNGHTLGRWSPDEPAPSSDSSPACDPNTKIATALSSQA